jgi:hypothetical protein
LKEKDKGWRHSAKLQAALVAGIIVVCIWITNAHDEQIVLRILAICELVICAAVGGHVSMAIGQMITDHFSQDDDSYTVDPKDVDDPEVR